MDFPFIWFEVSQLSTCIHRSREFRIKISDSAENVLRNNLLSSLKTDEECVFLQEKKELSTEQRTSQRQKEQREINAEWKARKKRIRNAKRRTKWTFVVPFYSTLRKRKSEKSDQVETDIAYSTYVTDCTLFTFHSIQHQCMRTYIDAVECVCNDPFALMCI